MQKNLIPDKHFETFLRSQYFPTPAPSNSESRTTRAVLGHNVEARDFDYLDSTTGMINDVCLNASAAMLQDIFKQQEQFYHTSNICALFSTHDLSRIRYKAPDDQLWRHVKISEYWAKKIWIIPIHLPQRLHWVLAVAYLEVGEVHLFDSLGGNKGWADVARVS